MTKAATRSMHWPVTLAFLLGPGERENLAPFLWPFRHWGGEVTVLDDSSSDRSADVLSALLGRCLGLRPDLVQVRTHALGGDFGAARNLLQDSVSTPWVLMADPDERWEEGLIASLPSLVEQLDQDRKTVCGFPRANFIEGVLVNDLPSSRWSPEGLLSALPATSWPPRNRDTQYRLLRREERWTGRLHERPESLTSRPDRVVSLKDSWILHNKSYFRQLRQDAYYKALGQTLGMPDLESLLSPGPVPRVPGNPDGRVG